MFDRLHERQAQRGQTLLQQTLFLFVQVALGFDLQHFQLVDEHVRRLEVVDRLAGFGTRHFAEKRQRQVGLLDHKVREKRGHQIFPAQGPRVVLGQIGAVHGWSCFRWRRISASKK